MSLERLDLSDNNLGLLTDGDVAGLRSLETLIGESPTGRCVAACAVVRPLTARSPTHQVSHNPLYIIPEAVGGLPLLVLEAAHCLLRALPPGLRKCDRLRVLSVVGNPICGVSADVTKLQSLTALHVTAGTTAVSAGRGSSWAAKAAARLPGVVTASSKRRVL